MFEIAVCEAQDAVRDRLQTWVKEECASCSRIAFFTKAEELLETEKHFDILFLAMDGQKEESLKIAEHMGKEWGTRVIFMSESKDDVFDVFDVEAFYYLLKPLEEEKTKEVLHRAITKTKDRKDKEPLIVRVERSYYHIPKDKIWYIENLGRKVVLHMKNREITYYAKMNELEEVLGSHFFRCHRGYFVNFAAVKSYESGSILLKNGESILMAKQKYNEFASAYADYLRAC